MFGLFRYPPSHEWLENCFPFDVNRSVLPDERCSLFSIREMVQFISVEIMYGGESVQNISKDDVQSIEIGIKNLVLVFSNGLTVHYYNLCYNT